MRITAETRVGAALSADPALAQRLIAFHPAFKRLNNPVLRRTMAKLVTFAEAARVAGVALPDLLAVANGEAAGAPRPAPPPVAAPAMPRPAWAADSAVTEALDVRPILATGRDPFREVMQSAARIGEGGVLRLDAPFDPAPLRRVLAGKGFEDFGAAVADGHWRLFFRRRAAATPAVAAPDAAKIWREHDGAHIDVRGLPAPQPMLSILRLLEAPDCPARVIVHHEREPLFLYPELAERGWRHAIVEGDAGEVRLRLDRGGA